jgi:hypothetical protein
MDKKRKLRISIRLLVLSVWLCIIVFGLLSLVPNRHFIREYIIDGSEIQDMIKYRGFSWNIGALFIKVNGDVSGNILVYIDPEKNSNQEFPQESVIMNFSSKFYKEGRCDWFTNECYIEIIPEDASVSGVISIDIWMNRF